VESRPTSGPVRDAGPRSLINYAAAEAMLQGALKWQETVNTDVVRFGRHAQIRYLAKKVANFLHEYHSNLFPGLDLPILPSDRSRLNVHAMLEPVHIARLLRRLAVSLNYFTLLRNM
jgi:hypothetical protein